MLPIGRRGALAQSSALGSRGCTPLGPPPRPHPGPSSGIRRERGVCRVRKAAAGPCDAGLLVPCGAWVTSGHVAQGLAQGLASGRAHGLCCIMIKAAQVFQRRLEAELVLVLQGRGETEAPAPGTEGSQGGSESSPRACSLALPWPLLWNIILTLKVCYICFCGL